MTVVAATAKSLAGSLGPAAGAAVMATGIVSVALHASGHEVLSDALLILTASLWLLLGAVFLHRLRFDRRRWREEARQPSSLTATAASAVLGQRLTLLGWSWAGFTLLVVAAALCLILLGDPRNVRGYPRTGAAFLFVVAPQSLTVLAAALAVRLGWTWLVFGAFVPFAFALGFYVVAVTRFDFAQLRMGAGDQWIAGGAIAISTLACAGLAQATTTTRTLVGLHVLFRSASLVLWVLTIAWLPALIGGEARWTRPRFDIRRWATVFPLGMYSVMSVTTGAATGSTWMAEFGRDWVWVALAAWIATIVGAGRAIRTRASSRARGSSPQSGAQLARSGRMLGVKQSSRRIPGRWDQRSVARRWRRRDRGASRNGDRSDP
jgi:tellurite resistance protein TehA-like permease